MIFVTLAQLVLAIVHGTSRDIKAGGPYSLRCSSLFPRKQSVRSLSARRSPQLVSNQGSVGCGRLEARAGIVALMSCCLLRLSKGGLGPPGEIVSLPACTQRSIPRGATLARRLDPLAFSGDTRGRSKALFFAALNQFPRSCCNCTVTGLASRMCVWRTIIAILRTPTRLVTNSLFFAVTQQQWRVCVRRMLYCKLGPAYCHPPLWIPD